MEVANAMTSAKVHFAAHGWMPDHAVETIQRVLDPYVQAIEAQQVAQQPTQQSKRARRKRQP